MKYIIIILERIPQGMVAGDWLARYIESITEAQN
jgi:hypothetical protein